MVKAGIVLANGSLSTSTSDEKAIRQALLEDHKVDAIVAMPSQMFIPYLFQFLYGYLI
jgi:Type I restriction-modification system methyltransferase subunit